MKKDTYFYPAVFSYEDGYDIAVTFPDLVLATQGESDIDALLMAKEALGGRIWCMEDDGEELPEPTPLNKVILEENEKAVLVEVFMPAIRLAEVNKSVNRTVTLPAWLDSVAKEKDVNFSRLLQDALITHLDISKPSI